MAERKPTEITRLDCQRLMIFQLARQALEPQPASGDNLVSGSYGAQAAVPAAPRRQSLVHEGSHHKLEEQQHDR